MTQLKNVVKIYVPSTIDGDKTARRKQAKEVKRTSKFLCQLYGGSTAQKADGYYINRAGKLVQEKPIICYANCTDADMEKTIKGIFAYAKRLRQRMTQECIGLEINGVFNLI